MNLRFGSRGEAVRHVQQQLNALLRPMPPLGVDGIFGQLTRQAVMEFQRREHLQVDGIVGPRTSAALRRSGQPSMPGAPVPPGVPSIPSAPAEPEGPPDSGVSAIAERAVQVAISQNGVREQPLGSNRGPEVDEYIRSTGLDPPALWCMAFVYWCFRRAARESGVENPMRRTASCTNLYSWARERHLLVTTPQRGDIFLVPGGEGGRTHHHTGLVTGSSGGRVQTIEGNTNDDGSSNGIGVFRRTRSAERLDYVRL